MFGERRGGGRCQSDPFSVEDCVSAEVSRFFRLSEIQIPASLLQLLPFLPHPPPPAMGDLVMGAEVILAFSCTFFFQLLLLNLWFYNALLMLSNGLSLEVYSQRDFSISWKLKVLLSFPPLVCQH